MSPISSVGRHPIVGLAILFVVTGVLASVASAGTVIEMRTVYLVENQPDEDATIFLDNNRMRLEAVEGGRDVVLIVKRNDAGDPVCWVIDTAAKTYREITKETAKELKSQIDRAKKTAEEQMERMPPGQRERVKKMMETQLSNIGKRFDVQFKEIATGVKVNEWTCTQLESYVDGAKYEDIWAADWKQIGLEQSDVRVFGDMGSLFDGVSPQTNAFFQMGKSKNEGGYEGFPVLVVEYKDGKEYEKSEVRSVRNEKLKGGLFELPEGLTKKSMLER
ncbi:MAG: hypothetical protein JSW58_04115 [Candidatus Latescibacterota bacterium]|nr:MAG: hypothetical protein JSW58_04115 [Candidatus Latescibacterota bacterium]